jgi:hypothetical protein
MNQPVGDMPGRYWHLLEDGRIQCDVCPRFCSCTKVSAVYVSCAHGKATR